jgi:hypothetical protein
VFVSAHAQVGMQVRAGSIAVAYQIAGCTVRECCVHSYASRKWNGKHVICIYEGESVNMSQIEVKQL